MILLLKNVQNQILLPLLSLCFPPLVCLVLPQVVNLVPGHIPAAFQQPKAKWYPAGIPCPTNIVLPGQAAVSKPLSHHLLGAGWVLPVAERKEMVERRWSGRSCCRMCWWDWGWTGLKAHCISLFLFLSLNSFGQADDSASIKRERSEEKWHSISATCDF